MQHFTLTYTSLISANYGANTFCVCILGGVSDLYTDSYDLKPVMGIQLKGAHSRLFCVCIVYLIYLINILTKSTFNTLKHMKSEQKIYQTPSMCVIQVSRTDVICTSDNPVTNNNEDYKRNDANIWFEEDE